MNNIKENMEAKWGADKAAILGLLTRRPKGTYTDDVASLLGMNFDRVRIMLHGLKDEGKAEFTTVEYEHLPVAIQHKVRPGMSRSLWKVGLV